jgi:hypothetical protein
VAPPPPLRPQIVISNRQLRDISREALNALEAANVPPQLFVRSGGLVRVRADEKRRLLIEPLSEAALRGRLTRVADFIKITGAGQSAAQPPVSVVRDIQTHPNWPFPALEGVVEIPVLRPDGTILLTPGYDPATGLYYCPDPRLDVSVVSETPTGEEVRAALDLIDEAIGEFPYDSEASKANALAALLTPIVRPACNGPIPLALFDAPQQGTGKTLLGSVSALIATGRPAAATPAPDNDEEWRKRITAMLISGSSIVLIDNLDGQLDSPSLAAALTSTVWRDRILGHSEMTNIPQHATWFASGNNIRLGGDMGRRCYWIRLDAQSSTPWAGRTFRHPDLPAWIAQNRGRLVVASLTLARAWYAAGQPPAPSPTIGSFESWSRTVGGILAHADVPGFLGNLDNLYSSADDENAEWEDFLRELDAVFGGSSFTAKDVSSEVGTSARVLDALPGELSEAWARKSLGVSFNKKLGRAFHKRLNRRHGSDEYRIERAGSKHGTQLWLVAKS